MAEGRNLREKKIEIWRKPIEEEFSFEKYEYSFMEGSIFEKYERMRNYFHKIDSSLVHVRIRTFYSFEEFKVQILHRSQNHKGHDILLRIENRV